MTWRHPVNSALVKDGHSLVSLVLTCKTHVSHSETSEPRGVLWVTERPVSHRESRKQSKTCESRWVLWDTVSPWATARPECHETYEPKRVLWVITSPACHNEPCEPQWRPVSYSETWVPRDLWAKATPVSHREPCEPQRATWATLATCEPWRVLITFTRSVSRNEFGKLPSQ